MVRLLRAEWLKLATVPVGWGLLGAAVLLSALAVSGAILSSDSAGVALESTAGVRRALHVTGTGSILVLVLGIVVSAGEYRTQTATDTFLTTPLRHQVLAAKMTLLAGVGAVFGLVSGAVAYVLAHILYAIEGATFPSRDTEVWLTLSGAMLYATLFAVLGVVFGHLVRNQVVAIVAALGWLLVVENLLITFSTEASKWLPGGAGQA
ncbi:MAG: ABC transporter permease, partial [Nocardioides sp.]